MITEKELCGILVSLKLLREDSPSDTLLWQHFFSRLKVQESKSWDPAPSYHFDPKTLLIALYFLSSSKASVKAQHIAQLFFDFP
jgi:hypothetical protein